MLRTKKTYKIKTIDGDKDLYIFAKLINPKVDNIAKTITFGSLYYSTYEVVVKEATEAEIDSSGIEINFAQPEKKETKTVKLHENLETYQEAQIEALYKAIKQTLPDPTGYFDMINDPIYSAFVFTVKKERFFGLNANEWEVYNG
jgi:hypothetical protein